MARESLEQTLTSLKQELRASDLDPRSLKLLHEIHDEIEAVLELSSEIPKDRNEGLRDRLGHAIEAFGASHPQLTRAMGSLVDTLTGLGL